MVMAPMTRGRAGASRTANVLMGEYYAQRVTAGLIVTEGTAISPQGYGWSGSPAIYAVEHVAGWRGVTDAVHQRGGRIFLQLWHTGRVSHPDFLEGELPIAPSAIKAAGDIYTPTGKKPYVVPRAMTQQEVTNAVREYAQAATRARDAGFDGVEIHAANGYLLDQFLRDGSNQRTDAYGGTVQKRMRFLIEVIEAVVQAWSPERVGIRFSPTNSYNDMRDSDPAATFRQAAKVSNKYALAYMHVVDDITQGSQPHANGIAAAMRAAFDGTVILNGGYDASTGAAAIRARHADLIAYGRSFLANPDLVERFRHGIALNQPDPSTFYTGGAKGYTDYMKATA
jgi:N-ethylmaleimide reductase